MSDFTFPAVIGPQNDHVLRSLSIAFAAALDLAEKKFTVLDVKIGSRNPVVVIQGERRCASLKGAVKTIHGVPGGRQCTMVFPHEKGAQIEWRADA